MANNIEFFVAILFLQLLNFINPLLCPGFDGCIGDNIWRKRMDTVPLRAMHGS